MVGTVGPDDNGRVVSAAAGEELTLALPQIAGTGYRWTLDPLPDGVELVSERTAAARFGAGPGAGGQRLFRIRVDRPVVLRARLRRPWEPPDAAVETFEVRIEPG